MPAPLVERRCDSCANSAVGPNTVEKTVRRCFYQPPIPVQYPSQPDGYQWKHSLHPQVEDDDWCWQYKEV